MDKKSSPTEPCKAWDGVPGFKSFDHPVTVREALEEINGDFEVAILRKYLIYMFDIQ